MTVETIDDLKAEFVLRADEERLYPASRVHGAIDRAVQIAATGPGQVEGATDPHAELREAAERAHYNQNSGLMVKAGALLFLLAELREAKAEIERLGEKSDAEMLRVKACEHIAEGEEGWETLRNECPSTAAVASLRDAYVALLTRAETVYADSFEAAVDASSEIISKARFGEIDQDFRAIKYIIEGMPRPYQKKDPSP